VSGGAVQAGETSQEAVIREVREETGLDVSNWEGGYAFSYKRENPGEGDNYFVDIYHFTANFDESDIKLQTEETDGYMLATVDDIKGLGEQGIFLHYDSIKKIFGL
jgi:8-oxo-dGTP pyrophosphatase MutT (NUDIX family)